MNPDGYCSPVTTVMKSTNGSSYTYNWDFGDGTGFVGDTGFVAHTFFNDGIEDTAYRVRLTISTSNGCTDSTSEVIPVHPNPRADFFVSPMVQDYPETDVTISNFSKPGNWKYAWHFGDGSISGAEQPGNHTYNTYGDFPIRLITYSIYCSDTMTRIVRILPPPPKAGFNPDTAGCSPLVVNFNNTSMYGENYLWDFDDGNFSTEKNPVHTFYTSRDYHVKLLVSGIKGNSEAKRVVKVYPNPRAEFNAYPDSATHVDQVFKFYNNSENAASYLWDFGDGSFSTDENPSYVYNKEGTFDISLYIVSPEGCPDTLVRERYIRVAAGEGEITFPNVFKWNGSGPTGGYWSPGELDNSVFHPFFENVEEYRLLIYSRWGELLYTSNDLYKGWDGYLKDGSRAPQGVYVYKAWVIYVDGRREVAAGDVTFLY